jgi:hypothetical protein
MVEFVVASAAGGVFVHDASPLGGLDRSLAQGGECGDDASSFARIFALTQNSAEPVWRERNWLGWSTLLGHLFDSNSIEAN